MVIAARTVWATLRYHPDPDVRNAVRTSVCTMHRKSALRV